MDTTRWRSILLILCPFIVESYYLSSNPLSQDTANAFCSDWCGSSLASIHSYSQHREANMTIMKDNSISLYEDVWIGLQSIFIDDTSVSGSWTDGSLFDYGLLKGQCPWGTNQPYNYTGSSQLCGYVQSTDYSWAQDDCEYENRPLCRNCNGVINKYVLSANGFDNWTEAKTYCETDVGTTLASIHSARDNTEAVELCKLHADGASCLIGLNDAEQEFNWVWTDNTALDYGSNVSGGIGPWLFNRPDGTDKKYTDQDYVRIQRPQYQWNDVASDEDDHINAALCNKPSELCRFVNKWNIIDGTMNFSSCEMIHDGTVQSQSQFNMAVIDDKQWFNGNNSVVVEYYVHINTTLVGKGAGIAIFNHMNNLCSEWYYIGIELGRNGSMEVLLRHVGKTE